MTPAEPRGGEAWTGPGTERHVYSPNAMMMGDCDVCGHTAEAHNSRPAPPVVHGWPDREAVARIVNPKAWSKFDRFSGYADHASKVDQIAWSQHLQPSLKTADAILSLFPPVVGWRGIDTAPRDGTLVLCFYSDRHGHDALSLRYWAEGDWPSSGRKQGWCDQHRSLRSTDPTHWMPLPAAPLTDGVGE